MSNFSRLNFLDELHKRTWSGMIEVRQACQRPEEDHFDSMSCHDAQPRKERIISGCPHNSDQAQKRSERARQVLGRVIREEMGRIIAQFRLENRRGVIQQSVEHNELKETESHDQVSNCRSKHFSLLWTTVRVNKIQRRDRSSLQK